MGPIAGAAIITSAINPIVAPRFSGGQMIKIVFINNGVINPVATAWTIRPTNKTENVGANPAINVPAKNVTIAIKTFVSL